MISEEKIIEKAKQRLTDSKEYGNTWRKEAYDDYNFVSGHQWSDEDKAYLQEQGRPPITFNYSEKMIDAICGAEVSNRQEVRYVPREVADTPVSQLWTEAAKWVRDECNAEDEETDAFRDCLICGIGATRTAMAYEDNQDGAIVISRRDPLNLSWDPAAVKPGLVDRRYDYEKGWMSVEECEERWPDAAIFASSADTDNGFTGVIRDGHRYEGDTENRPEMHKGQVEIYLYECYELEPYYRVADGDQVINMEEDEFKQLKSTMDKYKIQYVKLKKKVYYRGFFNASGTNLEFGKSPCQHGFTLNFMTGKRDRNRNIWYGMTRIMKDPQRWANKWLSQIIHIINSNAKGGLLAETGAFVDPRKAQDEWAKPDSVTLLNEGALSAGKIQQKQMAPYPTGLDRLMDFALNSLPMVTGINLEALGLANRDQANVLEQSRKQAAYGLLAPIFDALRRYRKVQGKVLLYFITEYISDGRMIRIVGQEEAAMIPLTKVPGTITYDIVVDQSPSAPDVKQRTWDQLMQIVPVMMKEGLPVPPDLLDFSPLPATLVHKWKSYIQQMGNVNPAQMKQMQQEMQQLQVENQQLKQDQSIKMGELQLKREQAGAEQQLDNERAAAELALEKFKIETELQLEAMKVEGQMRINEQKLGHDATMQKAKIQGDLKIKAASAGINQKEDTGDLSLKLDASDLSDSLSKIAESNAQLGDMMLKLNQTNTDALKMLVDTMNKPKAVVRDGQGRPIGVKPVDKISGA